jgi:recombination protein RecA
MIIDSLDALAPRNLLEGSMGDAQIGLKAKLLSEFFRKASPLLRHSNTALLATNQVREKIGVTMGNPEFIPGGRSQKFYASIIVRMLKAANHQIWDADGNLSGMIHKGRVEKSKVSAPFRECEVTVRQKPFCGIDLAPELYDLGKQFGLFRNRAGEVYSQGMCVFEKVELGNGRDNVILSLRAAAEISAQLEAAVRLAMANGAAGGGQDPAPY